MPTLEVATMERPPNQLSMDISTDSSVSKSETNVPEQSSTESNPKPSPNGSQINRIASSQPINHYFPPALNTNREMEPSTASSYLENPAISASDTNTGNPTPNPSSFPLRLAQNGPDSAVSMEPQTSLNLLNSDLNPTPIEDMDTSEDANEEAYLPLGSTSKSIPAHPMQPTLEVVSHNNTPTLLTMDSMTPKDSQDVESSQTPLVAKPQRTQTAKYTKAILERPTKNGYYSALAEPWDDMDTSSEVDQSSPPMSPQPPQKSNSPPTPTYPSATLISSAHPETMNTTMEGVTPSETPHPSHSIWKPGRPDLTTPPRNKRFNGQPSPARESPLPQPCPTQDLHPNPPPLRYAAATSSSPRLPQHSSDRQLIEGNHYSLHRHLTEADRLTIQLRWKCQAPCDPASLLLLYRLYHGGADLTPASLPTAMAREPQGDVIETLALMGIRFNSNFPAIFEANGGFTHPLNYGDWDYTAAAIPQETLLAACSTLPTNTWVEDQPSLPGVLTLTSITTQQELLTGLHDISLLLSRDGAIQLVTGLLTSTNLPLHWKSPPASTHLGEAMAQQAIARACRSRPLPHQGATHIRISGIHRALEDKANENTAYSLLEDALSRWGLLNAIDPGLLRLSLTGKWLVEEKDSETGSILIPLTSTRDPTLPQLLECRSKPFTLPQWRPPKDQPTKTPRSYSCSLSAQMLSPEEHAIVANRPQTFLVVRACASNTTTLARQIQSVQEYLEMKHKYIATHSTIQIGYVRHRTREDTNPLCHTTYEKCLYVYVADKQDQQQAAQVISRGYHLSLAPSVAHAAKTDPPVFSSTSQPSLSISYPMVTVVEVATVLSRIIPPADIGDVHRNDQGGVTAILLKQMDPATLDCIRAHLGALAEPSSTHVTHAPTPKGISFRPSVPGQSSTTPPIRTPSPTAPTRTPPDAGPASPKPLHLRSPSLQGVAIPRQPTPTPPLKGALPPRPPPARSPAPVAPSVPNRREGGSDLRSTQGNHSVRTQSTTVASPLTDPTVGDTAPRPLLAHPSRSEDIARLSRQVEDLTAIVHQSTATTRVDVAQLRASQVDLNNKFEMFMTALLSGSGLSLFPVASHLPVGQPQATSGTLSSGTPDSRSQQTSPYQISRAINDMEIAPHPSMSE